MLIFEIFRNEWNKSFDKNAFKQIGDDDKDKTRILDPSEGDRWGTGGSQFYFR